MNPRHLIVKWIWTVVALFFSLSQARAETVTATFVVNNPSHMFTYKLNGVTHGTDAGVFNFSNATGFLTGDFKAFCIDIAQGINEGDVAQFNVDQLSNAPKPGPGMGSARADMVMELFGRHFNDTGTADGAAAFQVAVWEITSETAINAGTGNVDLNLSSGFFRALTTTGWVTTAQTWLNELDGKGPKRTDLIALTSATNQDFVTFAPEPASFLLCGIGVLGLAVTQRKKLLSVV